MTDRPAQADRSQAQREFDAAAANVGLESRLLTEEFSALMSIPVFPDAETGVQLALAPTGSGAATPLADPKLLIAMLNAISLSDLMTLAVASDVDLRQELVGLADADRPPAEIDATIAAFLHGLLAMSLSDLMALDTLEDLVQTNLADRLEPDPAPLNPLHPAAAGALPTDATPPPADHLTPTPGPRAESIPVTVHALFGAGNDTVVFDMVAAGTYPAGTAYDALGGNDYVTLPSDIVEAQQAGYDPLTTFNGGAGNDTIVAGGLADIIAGGAGVDAVSYAGSSGVVVLLQDTDIHGPHASEPAGGAGGLAQGDSYTGIENVIASQFADYVYGSATGGAVLLLGGNDEFDDPETQDVPDYVDGGAGDDTMWGGAGGDTLIGGSGNDRIDGEAGTDSLDGGSGADTVVGALGADLLDGGGGADRLSGGGGDDVLVWRSGEALLDGGSGIDSLRVAGGDLALTGLAGVVLGLERVDLLSDAGSNSLTLTAADIIGMSDSDSLTVAGTAADAVNAGSGWTDGGSDGAGNHIFTKLVGGFMATLVVSDAISINSDITS